MSMTNDAGYRSNAEHSGNATSPSDSRSDLVVRTRTGTNPPTQEQHPLPVSPNLLWMFLSFGAGIILTSAWNRIRRTSWLNLNYHQQQQQQQRCKDPTQLQPQQPNDTGTSTGSNERHDEVEKSKLNSSIKNDASAPQKNVAKISSKPKWPWDRLKKDQQTVDTNDDRNATTTEAVSQSSSGEHRPRDNRTEENSTDNESTDQQQPDLPPQPQCCIGSIFGMDVGGTLAKLCYFESHSNNRDAADGKSYETSSKNTRRRNSMDGRIQYNSKNYSLRGYTANNNNKNNSSNNNNTSSGSHAVKRRNWVDHHCPQQHYDGNRNENSNATRDTATGTTNNSLLRYRTDGITTGTLTQIHLRRVHSLMNMATIRAVSVPVPKQNNVNYANTTTTDDHTMALHRFYDFARRLDTYRAGTRDPNLSFYSKELDGSFHFIKFETRRMMRAMDLIRTHKLHYNIHEMGGTGGGAHKFAAIWQQQLGIHMKKQDELDSLVAGMQFVLSTVIGECYTFRPDQDDLAMKQSKNVESNNQYGDYFGVDDETDMNHPQCTNTQSQNNETASRNINENDSNISTVETSPTCDDDVKREKEFRPQGDEWWWSRKVQRDSISASDSSTYPYLVVTIGTGVSILRVDGPRQYERVSGSTIGGGTYLGLIRLLTDVEDFDDVMRLAECGNPSKVDMMVGDIYGENSDALEKLGLPSNLVASSFGKLVTKDDPAAGLKQEDLARALLLMITNNIGQVAYLNAKIFQTPRIYFVGNFLRHNTISQRRLSYAINYWSKGEMEALFLEHEGYFGAMGAFLLAQDISVSDLTGLSGTNRRASTNTGPVGSKQEHLLHHHRRSATISNYFQ